jgi:poly-gamma-glutamate capsule biosynthesis protein CapA/YwtB (metallophosphatase superfamily)
MKATGIFLLGWMLAVFPAAGAEPEETVTVAAVGHLVMGTNYPSSHPALPADGGKSLFEKTKDLLSSADLTFGNLAAPLSSRGKTHKKVDNVNVFAFRTPPSYGTFLKEAGFDVLQAANNHILDFGADAYEDTLALLDKLGIGHIGRKGEVWFSTVRGITVGFVGFTQPYTDFFESHHDIGAAAKVVLEAKKKCQVLVVGFHGGTEGKDSLHTPEKPEYLGKEYRGEVVKLSHALVDAGADLVVGFGPHLPRAMEFYKGKLIDYALGNFLTYGPFNLRGPSGLSLILKATFDKNGKMVRAWVDPIAVISPGIPEPDGSQGTLRHLRSLSKEDFPKSYPEILDDGTVREQGSAR